MTTIIAQVSRHAAVLGADSLATQIRQMVPPARLYEYFDPDQGWKLKLDADGTPLLKGVWDVTSKEVAVPYNQERHVNKLFKIGTLPIGAVVTGISSIGTASVRSIIAGAVAALEEDRDYEVKEVAADLLGRLRTRYQQEYDPQRANRPDLELLVAGYGPDDTFPTVTRINVRSNEAICHYQPGQFGVAFGGQIDWIQRIVFGTDNANKARLSERVRHLLSQYRATMLTYVRSHGLSDLPEPGPELDLFHNWSLQSLNADWGDFSEQSAINCVDFLLRIMIGSQDVSSTLPTVGGNVHIAVIRKDGFFPVSKEVWRHGDHEVPIPEVGR